MTDPAQELDLLPGRSDEDYFDSYADPGVHRLMIADHARTDAYRRALEEVVRPGTRVLDVGSGTGILSFFAARAGAGRVIGVDNSRIVEAARDVALANGLSDRVEFVRDRAEDVELDAPVDLIVSEWMGFFALAECMFTSVVEARDRHLAPGGTMMPSRVRLTVAPVENAELHEERGIGLWEKPVYGFDFTPMIDRELTELLSTAVDVPAESLLGPGCDLIELDCHDATSEDFFFQAAVELPIRRDGRVHGLAGWFDVDLAPGITLSTSPHAPATHWRQSFFPVRPFPVQRGDVIELAMRATPKAYADRRLPLYFVDGLLRRGEHEVHSFFYCHAGSFE